NDVIFAVMRVVKGENFTDLIRRKMQNRAENRNRQKKQNQISSQQKMAKNIAERMLGQGKIFRLDVKFAQLFFVFGNTFFQFRVVFGFFVFLRVGGRVTL